MIKKTKPARKKVRPVAEQVAKAQERWAGTWNGGTGRERTDKPEDPDVAKPRRRDPSDYHTLAASATAMYGGKASSIEQDHRLIGRNRYVTYLNTLLNSDVAAIAVRALMILLADIKWHMEPGKGKKQNDGDESTSDASPAAVEWANVFETMLLQELRTPWSKHVRKMAMHLYVGFSWLEWQAKVRDDGKIGFHDLFEVSPLTLEGWDINKNGEVHGIIQQVPKTGEYKYIPREKSIYLCDDAFAQGDPGGVGVFRHVVRKVRELESFEQIEKDGYENDLRGVPWARAPLAEMDDQGISEEKKAEITKPLDEYISGQTKKRKLGIMMDSAVYKSTDEKGTPSAAKMVDVGILTGDGQGHAEIHNVIVRKNQEIARPMFAAGFILGDGAGNRALAEARDEFFALLTNSIATDIADATNRDAVPALGKLNNVPEDELPRLVPGAVTAGDVSKVATMLMQLAQGGAKLEPDDPAISVLRERAKLPPVPRELADRAVDRLDQEMKLKEETAMADAEAARMGAETQRMSAETSAEQGDKKLQIDAKAQAAAAKKPAAGGGTARKARKKK